MIQLSGLPFNQASVCLRMSSRNVFFLLEGRCHNENWLLLDWVAIEMHGHRSDVGEVEYIQVENQRTRDEVNNGGHSHEMPTGSLIKLVFLTHFDALWLVKNACLCCCVFDFKVHICISFFLDHQGCHICCISLRREANRETLRCQSPEENGNWICPCVWSYHFL